MGPVADSKIAPDSTPLLFVGCFVRWNVFMVPEVLAIRFGQGA
jgi:hypothetical protein